MASEREEEDVGCANLRTRRSSRRSTQTPAKFSPCPGIDTVGKRRTPPSIAEPSAKRRSRKSCTSSFLLTTPEGLPLTSVLCAYCTGDEEENKKGEFEALLTCSTCHESAHPSCLPMSQELAHVCRSYQWQCFSCKACQSCDSRTKQSKILLCDLCDRGYHTFCLNPPLKEAPSGDWQCPRCCGDVLDENPSSTGFDDVILLADTKHIAPPAPSDAESPVRNPASIIKRPKDPLKSPLSPATTPSLGLSCKLMPTEKVDESDEDVKRIRQKFASGIDREHVDMFVQCYVSSQRQSREEQALWRECVSRDASEVSQTASIRSVCLGDYEMETRFSSPYPEEFSQLKRLFLCSFCLVAAKSPSMLRRHMVKCLVRYPPGKEIYRKQGLSVFEVDGDCSKEYCQRLCLLAKLFLHHKTLYRQVEPFRFYVLAKIDGSGFHLIGYFSKEKESLKSFNVSCILVLPSFTRQGYGRLLIDLSYLLSQREGKIGSPERPLSDLGLVSYRSYWKSIILAHLQSLMSNAAQHASSLPVSINIKSLSQQTSIRMVDLISTMQYIGILKYWRGSHIVLLNTTEILRQQSSSKKTVCPARGIDEKALHWKPSVNG